MRNEIQLCLIHGGDVDEAGRAIRATITAEHQAKLRALESELTAAKLIKLGLSEPQKSPAYRLANSFMATFRKHHAAEIKESAKLVRELMNGVENEADEALKMEPTIDGREV